MLLNGMIWFACSLTYFQQSIKVNLEDLLTETNVDHVHYKRKKYFYIKYLMLNTMYFGFYEYFEIEVNICITYGVVGFRRLVRS